MWHSAVSSLLQLCCELVIEREINFKEHTELPDDVMAKLERTNVESSDRRFRVLHIPTAQHSTLTIKEILNERGISPLFSNVYVSLDLSPLHLKWGIDASKFEDGDDHEDDEEHRDAVNVEISSPQPTGAGKPNAPKAGVSSEEAVIELKSEDEVLVFLPDCLTDDVRENGPCLYGRGALYSKLGIEPDDWRAAGIVRLRSDTLQRTISDEDMNEDDMAVLVQTRDVERMMPGHSNLLCVEASKRTSDPQVHKIPYHAQYSRLPDEVKEYLELKKAQTGFLHMGVCGSDLTFYVNTLYDYVPDDPASFVQVCIWPILSELDHGPEFRLLPRMARVTEGMFEYSVRDAKGIIARQRDLSEYVRLLFRKIGMIEVQEP